MTETAAPYTVRHLLDVAEPLVAIATPPARPCVKIHDFCDVSIVVVNGEEIGTIDREYLCVNNGKLLVTLAELAALAQAVQAWREAHP
jgi:hypothetical protein